MVAALKRGDEVITSGGILAKVERVLENDRLEISIADNIVVKVVRSTIQSVTQNKTDTKK